MANNILTTLLLAALMLAACANKGDDGEPFLPNAPSHPDPIKLVQIVNDFRATTATCGNKKTGPAKKVAWSDSLAAVAKKHSQDMLSNDKLSHVGTDGSFVNDRLKVAGYEYSFYAENLLKGGATEVEAVNAWKKSAAHCENLMDPNIKEFGVGTAGPYWTMVLATRK